MLLPKPDNPCRVCNCPLYGSGMGFSQLEGSGSNGVLVVAEALGEHEERDGLPLRPYADAGSVFQEATRLVGEDRGAFALTNVCRCRPPGNVLEGAPYEMAAIGCCQGLLDEAVRLAKPRCILALGGIPLRTLTGLTGPKRSVTQIRGYVLESPRYGVPVVATYHPSFIKRGAPALTPVFMRDMRTALRVARDGVPPVERHYVEYPTEREALEFVERVERTPDGLLSYDIETVDVVGMEEEDLEFGADKQITQIQFSLAPTEGISFPAIEPYLGYAHRIFQSPIHKFGFNNHEYDDVVLRAHDFPIMGTTEDLRWMFHHLYPDIPGKTHKGGLQWVGAFVCPEFGPWKHLYGANLAWYGAADVDMPHRIRKWLVGEMKRAGVWDSYQRFVVRVRPILDRMSERGIALDLAGRAVFYEEIRGIQRDALGVLQGLVPDRLKGCLPEEGYKNEKIADKTRAKPLAEGEKWERRVFMADFKDRSRKKGRVLKKDRVSGVVPSAASLSQEETSTDQQDVVAGTTGVVLPVSAADFEAAAGRECEPVERWCRVQPFKPSSQQLKAYMRHRGHKIPKIPGSDTETANKLGLQRLYARTRDPLYPKVLEYLEAQKIASTYIDGWEPRADGKVHTTFTFRPATGQLSSMRPNCQNIPRRVNLAKPFRKMIVASPGCTLVSFDYKSFHALTLGFEAKDPDYIRAACTDIHSIFAATQILGVEKFDTLWALPDDELMERLRWWRANTERTWPTSDGPKPFKYVRDFRAKPAILGYGFGLQGKHLYEANTESFDSKKQAQQVLDAIDAAFPRTKQFRFDIRQLAQQRKFLLSRHGCIRWLWAVMTWDSHSRSYKSGPDAQKAIAFLPANDAFCHIKEAMVRIDDAGWAERYGLVNQIHDDLTFDCPTELVDECRVNVRAEMERPSTVLVNAVAPQGLACAVSVSVGPNLGSMAEQ